MEVTIPTQWTRVDIVLKDHPILINDEFFFFFLLLWFVIFLACFYIDQILIISFQPNLLLSSFNKVIFSSSLFSIDNLYYRLRIFETSFFLIPESPDKTKQYFFT